MAARRRRKTTRRGKTRPLPRWAVLVLGLAIGVLLVLIMQFVIERTRSSDSGLSRLFASSNRAAAPRPGSAPSAGSPADTRKPRFDFYTILPEIETVLPSRETKSRPAPRTTAPETGARYMLQAASFGNYADADRLKARLALAGLEANIEKVTIENRGQYFRVRLGPYEHLSALDTDDRKLAGLGIRALRLKVSKAAAK